MAATSAAASLVPEFQPLQVWVGSWNAACLEPPYDRLPLAQWLLSEGESERDGRSELSPTCDLYVIGFQARESPPECLQDFFPSCECTLGAYPTNHIPSAS